MSRYFKGKSVNYSTTITLSKKEQAIVWILLLIAIVLFILNIFIFDSVWMIVLFDFIIFLVMFGIFFLILFSRKYEEERIENEKVIK